MVYVQKSNFNSPSVLHLMVKERNESRPYQLVDDRYEDNGGIAFDEEPSSKRWMMMIMMV